MDPSISKQNLLSDFSLKGTSYYTDNYLSDSPRNYLRRLRRALILEAVGGRANDADVLDAGCGPAVLFDQVLAQCRSYVAMDLTPSNLEHVRRAHPENKVICVQADLDDFKWEKAVIDVLICSGAIEYTARPDHVLGQMCKALAPGGLLVCSFPNQRSYYRRWSEAVYTPLSRMLRFRNSKTPAYKRHLFSPESISTLLQQHLADVQIKLFGFKILPQPIDQLMPNLDYRISSRLQASGLGSRFSASEFLAIAHKPTAGAP